MSIARRLRFSMATVMMLVVAAAAGSAAFAKFHEVFKELGGGHRWGDESIDFPIVLVMATALTAVALGSVRRHTAVQTLLQATLAYLMLLALGSLAAENPATWARRGMRYWLQGCFALTVVLPLLAFRAMSSTGDPSDDPRRLWWRRTFEAVIASFVNLVLIGFAILTQEFLRESL